jgi:predicted amidophosphoribosyltransferase
MWLLDLLFPPRSDERVARDISADEFLAHLSPALVASTTPATVALLPFSQPEVRAIIHEAKYHGSEHSFELLSLALAEYLRDADDIGRAPIFIPVPLGSTRRKERGFNQVEEILKRAPKGELDPSILVRTRETVSQVSLPKTEREKNMRGAFSAARPLDPVRTYLVVDDDVTTGATLQAAIDALTAAGAKHIIPLAIAH